MDYQAIIEALDARTLEAFKAWGETFAKDMKEALAERDKQIYQMAKQIRALENQREADWSAVEARDATLSDRIDDLAGDAQKQVREALARAPIPTYKGVFDREAEYQAGDMVTHKGSVWHCNEPIWQGNVPGADSAWTLAVKCGRDGKDLTKESA